MGRDEPPPPAGVAQEPSPRQNVVADADVPELRLVTGRLPVTPVVSGKPVNPVAAPANDVAVNTPVLGTKLSLVDDVVAPTFPVVADEMTG